MSKEYKKGYNHGDSDGKKGENNLASRTAKRLLNPTFYLLGAKNRDDQYISGYKAGFEDRIRTKQVNITNKSNETGNNSMSNTTSFAHQVELLVELKQYLSSFQERLLSVASNYESKVEAMHGAGMMDETYQRFSENELEETRALIQQLVEHIGDNDIPAVEQEINFLAEKL
jgi:hypothetical protein